MSHWSSAPLLEALIIQNHPPPLRRPASRFLTAAATEAHQTEVSRSFWTEVSRSVSVQLKTDWRIRQTDISKGVWNRGISAECGIVSDRWESGGGSDLAAPVFRWTSDRLRTACRLNGLLRVFFPQQLKSRLVISEGLNSPPYTHPTPAPAQVGGQRAPDGKKLECVPTMCVCVSWGVVSPTQV